MRQTAFVGRPPRVSFGVVVVAALLASSSVAFAQQDARLLDRPLAAATASAPFAPSGQAAAAPAPTTNPVLDFFSKTEISGLVDASFSFNFNKPKTPCATVGGVAIDNCLHNFDVAHNSFSLNLAEIALEKKPTADSRGGFRIDLDYGSTANIVGGFEPTGTTAYSNVQQAYVSYLAPTKSGSLQIDFGKFVTPAGSEVIESKDNWNYSRSLLFALAIPYYHAGARVAYSPNDKVTVTGFLVNGWNNVVDANAGKTVAVAVALKPTSALAVAGTYIAGPEQTDPEAGWRHLFDGVVTYTASPKLSFAANVDIGGENGASWQGIAAYAKYQANDWFAVVPRYEYFSDPDGWATLVPQHVQDLTLTMEFKAKSNLLMRVEYRGDFSNERFFIANADGTSKTQNALTVGWMYSFSSKNQ
jgi:hypothetical protein